MTLLLPTAAFTQYTSNQLTPVNSNPGTTVTADVTSHTMGAYSELIASLPFDAYYIEVWLSGVGQNATATSLLCDIALGAAGSETVIISNLNGGACNIVSSTISLYGSVGYAFPLFIPSNSRLSARCQALISADTVQVVVRCWGAPSRPVWAGQTVTTYGANTSTSRGIDVAAGISAAEGSWTQIAAATSGAHSWISAGVGGAADITTNGTVAYLDIGVGTATEAAVVTDQVFGTTTSEVLLAPPLGGWVHIPGGARLVARCSVIVASAQSYDVILYGVS